MAKYRLDNVDARTDGSGMVRFDVWALDTNGAVIPSRHKDVMVPSTVVAAAMAKTGAARTAAMKDALLEYAGPGWEDAQLDAEAIVNAQTTAASDAVNAWLTLPQEFAL